MILRAAACSDVGKRRKQNEDRFALAPELGLFLVCDGMGGHKAGQVASELASESALQAVRALEGGSVALAERLRHCVEHANREIFSAAKAQVDLTGMGTTMVAILATSERAALAHVGDSRAYLIRRGRIRQLTDDHSLVGELLRRREISKDDAREHPQRHVLTRAVGVRDTVQPDLAELTPMLGDCFVMCSDGLTNHVPDDEIAFAFAEPGCDLQAVVEELVAMANARGGEDNITIVALRYESEGA